MHFFKYESKHAGEPVDVFGEDGRVIALNVVPTRQHTYWDDPNTSHRTLILDSGAVLYVDKRYTLELSNREEVNRIGAPEHKTIQRSNFKWWMYVPQEDQNRIREEYEREKADKVF